MHRLGLQLRILTPLWTGNIDADSPALRETGIIGSLRWWYEGLLRGCGIEACDPTQDSRCQFDVKAYKAAKSQGQPVDAAVGQGLETVCDSCKLFGCTGWARRFRISSSPIGSLPLFFVSNPQMANLTGNWLIRVFDGKKQTFRNSEGRRETAFSFQSRMLWADSFSLTITTLHGYQTKENEYLVAYVLYLATKYGGLGAKTQNGFGQVKIVDWAGWEADAVEKGRALVKHMNTHNPLRGRPFNLGRFFSHTYELSTIAPYDQQARVIGQVPSGFRYQDHFIPCAFDIRFKSQAKNPFTRKGVDIGMRPYLRQEFGRQVTDCLLGESRPRSDDDRAASRIHVSHLYRDGENWYLKVWGDVPSGLADERGRDVRVDMVSDAVDRFIAGKGGMFPNSRLVTRFDRRQELGE